MSIPSARSPSRRRPRAPILAITPTTTLCAGLALLLTTDPLAAQEPDTLPGGAPDSVRFELQSLRVEATRPTITSGGASAVELTLDSARTVPSPTLAEVLRDMPLVRVRRNSRGQVQPSLRGMEERQIAVLVDGVPITLGWDNRADLSVIPLTAANEIRMVRGLSSVLSGPNALGGVVEVGITSGPFPDRSRRPGRVRAGFDDTGSLALVGEASHLWEEGEGGFWLRYGAGYWDSPGLALAGSLPAVARDEDGRLLNSDTEYGNAFLAARWQAEDGGEWLSLSSSGFTAERGVVPELHLIGGTEPGPRLWRIPEHRRSITSLSGGTGWGETPFGEGDLEFSVGLDFQHLEIDSYESLAFADSVDGETGDDRTLTFRMLGDHTLGAGTLRGALTVAETWHRQVLPSEPVQEFRQRLWSVGVEVDQPLAPGSSGGLLSNPRLTVGASLDGSSTPETGDKPSQPAIDGWGGRLAGQATVGGAAVVHGGLSRKVRFPALRELFSGALGKFVPNPDLKPLILWVAELGSTIRPAEGLEVQATLFQQRLLDAIVRAVVEDGRFQRQNRGETRATGLELLANWRLGSVGLRADATLQRVNLLDDGGEETGEKPEYQPEVDLGLAADAVLPLGLRAAGEMEFLGTQFGANPMTGEFEEIDPTVYLELGLSRRFEEPPGNLPPLTLSVTAENLGDEDIFDQLGLPRPGRTVRFEVTLF